VHRLVTHLCVAAFAAASGMFGVERAAMLERTRIVALGDSTTAGTPGWKSPIEAPPGGSGDETSQYAYWLMRAHPEWEVLNRGVNGERSDQMRVRFDRDVINARPKVVIIIAGVNDVYQGYAVNHVIGALKWMYDRATQDGILVVTGTIVPFNTATPEQNEAMRRINGWIREQSNPATVARIAVADTGAAVAAPGRPDQLIESPDGLHPSVRGYRLMADALQPLLEKLLR
jgi:acyl-CoA thioesterase-1